MPDSYATAVQAELLVFIFHATVNVAVIRFIAEADQPELLENNSAIEQ
jgi:hypothetical protein